MAWCHDTCRYTGDAQALSHLFHSLILTFIISLAAMKQQNVFIPRGRAEHPHSWEFCGRWSESEAVSASLCPLQRMEKSFQAGNTYWWAWQTRRAWLSLEEREKSVSAELLFADFWQQWCSQLHSNLSSCFLQDLPHTFSQADALNPANPSAG